MTVTEKRYLNGAVISVDGHLDSLSSPQALAAMQQIIETAAPLFVFECDRLDYVSSAGLRVFLEIAKKVKARHRAKVAIAGLNPMMREIFEIAGFNTLFSMHQTLDDPALGLVEK